MNKRLLLTLATAIGITAAVTTAVAAPLPAGTKLTITKTTDGAFVGPLPGCTNGSCFGMFLFGPIKAWSPIVPGTDGGIIIGKPQKSGGQEIDPLSTSNSELTEMWYVGGNTGTFFTAPDASGNIFDDTSCTGSGCIGKTELKVWNMAHDGQTIPLGSAGGCDPVALPICTPDQTAGIFVKTWDIDPAGTVPRKYRLTYNQVIPVVFTNYPFDLVLEGEVMAGHYAPVVTVTPGDLTGVYGVPIPFTISVGGGIPAVPTCRVGTVPANGMVVLDGCTSGTYTANIGFIGTDSFSLIANDGLNDSAPATVTAAITAPTTDTECTDQHPVTQVTVTGKQGRLSVVVTGNIISFNSNGKEIKICPSTKATYEATTNTPGATVVCQVKSNTSRGQGHLKVNDHIKCTDKPVGNDKLYFKIKSGVNQRAM